MESSDIELILGELRKFNQKRDWDQLHNGKDLAIGLSASNKRWSTKSDRIRLKPIALLPYFYHFYQNKHI
jgi:hypothetical protein